MTPGRGRHRAPGRRLRGWRKLAGATWGAPNDPQFYGDLEIDAGALLEYQLEVREVTGVRVTLTHLIGRAVAHALRESPGMCVRIARGREYPRESADVFFIVSDPTGEELTGVKIARADEKSAVEIAEELAAATTSIRAGTDAAFARTKLLLERLPIGVVRRLIRVGAWLSSDRDLDLPALGLRRESFGGAMITSVGMWGITRAYSPLADYYRVPVLVLIGAVRQRPVAVTGRVVVRPVVVLTATFDHRYVDGAHAAKFADAVQTYCADPSSFEPDLVRASSPAT